jgi:DNA repair ATPase RecN
MVELQNNFLNINISTDTSMLIDEYSDTENENTNNNSSGYDNLSKIDKNIKKRKKRKVKNKGKQKNYKSYEIEKIIDHKLENNIYKFLVKWKDYPDNDSSWLIIDNFNEKSMLKTYIEFNNIGTS